MLLPEKPINRRGARDEDENKKITEAEALKKLDKVKNFIEVNGNDHFNIIFDQLIENVVQMKAKN